MLRILSGFGLPAEYAAIIVADQEAIREGRGAEVRDDIPRVLGRPAGDFRAAMLRANLVSNLVPRGRSEVAAGAGFVLGVGRSIRHQAPLRGHHDN